MRFCVAKMTIGKISMQNSIMTSKTIDNSIKLLEEDVPHPPLKKYKKIPIHIVEDHNDALRYIYRAIGSKHLPVSNNTIIHLDSHPDLLIARDLKAEAVDKRRELLDSLCIENWILPAAFAGYITKIVWIKPPWAKQMSDGVKHFQIGKNEEGKVRVNSVESYFVYDGLFCPSEQLDNKKDILLSVGTMALFEDEESEKIDEKYSATKLLESTLEVLKKLEEYILDIDLDFFSTMNPFKDLYEKSSLYERLKEIYIFSLPSIVTESGLIEATQRREQQLEKLNNLFTHLETHRDLGDWQGEKDHYYRQVCDLSREVRRHYSDKEIDWMLVHDAGCTCDDTELPHKVLGSPAIKASITGPFRTFLKGLPSPPTIITMARSSEDDYCPPEQVEMIQNLVLEELKQVFSVDEPNLHY